MAVTNRKQSGYEKAKVFFLTYNPFEKFISLLEEKLGKEKILNSIHNRKEKRE